ncbi:glycerate kinase [Jonesiaceae bacterium BS-20]|uniref:Glycerate kinase n=1 Tax=Jonesiaceae bacterium BS-20 TaxID=3120821 RepID=A0AAU7DQN2_9MICO
MQVVVALDSFKGSVSSVDAGLAVAKGVRAVYPGAEVTVLPIADGGEGTLEAWAKAPHHRDTTAQLVPESAANCFGASVPAQYLLETQNLPGGKKPRRAILECAQTVGLVGAGVIDDTTSLRASSAGLGEQVLRVLERGVTSIAIGLGGSACTDGGVGFLQALGAKITDAQGNKIQVTPGKNPLLDGPTHVELPDLNKRFGNVELIAMTDVSNRLTGPAGAARIFGPQKGATSDQIDLLERHMEHWAKALAAAGRSVAKIPGAGAAGGLGAALLALGGQVKPGLKYLVDQLGYTEYFRGADLVFTGEGAIDASTMGGKAPAAIAKLAKKMGNARVVALAGKVDLQGLTLTNIDQVLCIHEPGLPLEMAMNPQVTLSSMEITARGVVQPPGT